MSDMQLCMGVVDYSFEDNLAQYFMPPKEGSVEGKGVESTGCSVLFVRVQGSSSLGRVARTTMTYTVQ